MRNCSTITLSQLIKKAGWRVVYDPQAETMHHSGKSIGKVPAQRFGKGLYGQSRYFRTLHGGGQTFLFNFIAAAGFFLRSVLYFFGGLFLLNKKVLAKSGSSMRFFNAAVQILAGSRRYAGSIGNVV